MKFLVADDHPLVRRALSLSLEHIRPDATLLEAETAEQARTHVMAHPDIDLVLLDLSMPDSEGLDGLRQIKALLPGAPVAVVSADESADTAVRALAAGAAGYLPKSLPEDVLRAAISLILAGGMYVPSLVADAAGATGGPPQRRPLPAMASAQSSGTAAGGRGTPGAGALTQRQREVLDLVIEGLSNKEIAERLDLAEATVKVHMTAILRAYGVNNRTKAISAAQRERDRALAPAT